MLGDLTGLAVRFGPTQHYEGGLFGNAVMTRLPIQDVHIQPLPYTESTPARTTYPRGAIAVTLETKSGRSLRFVVRPTAALLGRLRSRPRHPVG